MRNLHFVPFLMSLIVPSAQLFVLQIKTDGKTACKKVLVATPVLET